MTDGQKVQETRERIYLDWETRGYERVLVPEDIPFVNRDWAQDQQKGAEVWTNSK